MLRLKQSQKMGLRELLDSYIVIKYRIILLEVSSFRSTKALISELEEKGKQSELSISDTTHTI